jgi:hypothetical protein
MQKTRDNFQALIIYLNWCVILIPVVSITFVKCDWTRQDSVVSSLIMTASLVVFAFSRITKRGFRDPLIRGLFVGLFRVIPHLYLTYCILHAGSGQGLAGITVFAANITAISRIITLSYSGIKSGWEKSKKASLWSEIFNEGSWLIVTAVWMII